MEVKEENIINWVKDYSKGELSDGAKNEMEAYLQISKANRDHFNYYRRLYYNARSLGFKNYLNEEKAWTQINESIKKQKTRRLYSWLSSAAAVIIVALISTLVLLREVEEIDFSKDYNFAELAQQGSKRATLTLADGTLVKLEDNVDQIITEGDGVVIAKDSLNNITYLAQGGNKKLEYNTIDVPRAGEYSLTLSDGTRVWLNAETVLRFPVKFSHSKREVFLTGEAYFEVEHNKNAPFIVHAYDTEVMVLGTSFNVSAYADQEYIATTLVEGSVQVDISGNTEILKPTYQSTVRRGSDEIEIKQVDTQLYTSWVDGVYEFEDVELEYILTQVGRWYDVNFFFEEEQFKHIRFTGAFEKKNSFELVLNMIERIADVDFAIKEREIIVGRQ